MEIEGDYKKFVKTILYIELFVFSAFGFIALLCLLGFVLSKILFGIMFAVCLFYVIIFLTLLKTLDSIIKEEK